MKKYLLYILLLASVCLHSQTKDAVLAKVKAEYSAAKPLQFNTTYNLYKTYQSKNIAETYTGVICKSAANDFYIKINATEYVVTGKIAMQVNHEEKAIVVTKTNPVAKDQYDIDYILKTFDHGTFKDKKTYWEMELLSKKASPQAYSRIVLHIGKDYLIQKQVFYYNTGVDFSNDYSKEDIQKPKLEVIFSKVSRKPVASSRFDTSPYFTVTKKGIRLSEKYSNYELIDQR